MLHDAGYQKRVEKLVRLEEESLIKTVRCFLCSFSYFGYLVVLVRLGQKGESGEDVLLHIVSDFRN